MIRSSNPGSTVLKAFMVAAGISGAAAIAGHFTVQPGHDAWQAELAAAQEQAAEARAAAQAQAEADAAAEAEAEAARRADERRQQAQQALSRSMGGAPGGVSGGVSGGSTAGPATSGGGYNPLAPGGAGGASNAGYDGPRNPDLGNLPDTDGVETVFYNCTSCHSATVFTQQRMTRDRWDYTLDWMVTNGGMAELPDADRETVLEYLVRHFSS